MIFLARQTHNERYYLTKNREKKPSHLQRLRFGFMQIGNENERKTVENGKEKMNNLLFRWKRIMSEICLNATLKNTTATLSRGDGKTNKN